MGKFLIPLLAIASLWPAVPAPLALCLGVVAALLFGNPYLDKTRLITPRLMAWSIVGLGFGMNLVLVLRAGQEGLLYTIAGISLALGAGFLFGKMLRVPRDLSLLIGVGTAICGGSAIAAVSSVIRPKSHEITVALGTVFLLNALALLIFPPLGHAFGLSPIQFGYWAALAIHDTSSVVGAAMEFSTDSVELATTVKLARALWIVPLAFTIGWLRSREGGNTGAIKKPWFILGFLLAAAIVTWWPVLRPYGQTIEWIARRTLVLTLFLIGAGLTRSTLRAVGYRPFTQGVLLWLTVSGLTLAAIAAGWIG